jgi:hypothetical protein
MKPRNLKIFLPIALAALTACVPLKPYDGVVRAPKTEVEVFEPGRTPARPYKVIMSFSDRGNIGDEAHFHRSFVEQAKQLGADAVILKPTVMGGTAFGLGGGKSESAFSALAIVYQ